MTKKIFITGVGSGLGYALAKRYIEQGESVYAVGRVEPPEFARAPNFLFFPYDLAETFTLKSEVSAFVRHHAFDIALLNAGILGEIKPLCETSLEEIQRVMDINVWANKELIDTLDGYGSVKQVVGFSSGAAVNGSKGWGPYALSKTSLNMLFKVYAKELPHIHFTALAPGVIKTPMVEHILHEVDRQRYPSAQRLAEGPIQSPDEAAKKLIALFDKLTGYESGSFVDVRQMV
jgi:NAD(P)-dependent dehydrogenase (short-subunit alcohol dehydrogenase family)